MNLPARRTADIEPFRVMAILVRALEVDARTRGKLRVSDFSQAGVV